MVLGIRYQRIIFILIVFAFVGCNSSKYIPEGKYLLSKVSVEAHNSDIPDKEFEDHLRQQPNKKIFGFILTVPMVPSRICLKKEDR